MKLLNCGPDCPVLLCTCVGDNFHSLFSVCSLSENREVQGGQFQTFDEWSHANSMLTCTKLECREIPEAVQIDSALIRGALYLCVVCSHQLMLYELPATDAVSCKWMDNPVIRKSSCKILHAKLRYLLECMLLWMHKADPVRVYCVRVVPIFLDKLWF